MHPWTTHLIWWWYSPEQLLTVSQTKFWRTCLLKNGFSFLSLSIKKKIVRSGDPRHKYGFLFWCPLNNCILFSLKLSQGWRAWWTTSAGTLATCPNRCRYTIPCPTSPSSSATSMPRSRTSTLKLTRWTSTGQTTAVYVINVWNITQI